MTFLSEPILRPVPLLAHLWELTTKLVYADDTIGLITVHPGAVTDGASIPRLLWTLVGSPMRDSRVLRAAIVHDQLYKTLGLNGQLSRAACDALFRRALQAAGVPVYKAWLYWSGVRTGGWIGWNAYARHPATVQAELARIDLTPSEQRAPTA